MEQIRLTIVAELYAREMGVRQFYETIGGSSYDSVRRHFLKLAEHGWLRKVRTAAVEGRGRPEALYRSTELAVIDGETWRSIPGSIRDAVTVQLLKEMAGRLGDALGRGAGEGWPDGIADFKTIEVDELGWCKALAAVERCFSTLLQEQNEAKYRLETSSEQPFLMTVSLAAFEAVGSARADATPLPTTRKTSSPAPWPQRIGRVFADRLDLEIVNELNRATMTPAQLQTALGGASSQTYLRRCKRLADLGWAVNVDTVTGGSLHGASVYRFRAAAPDVSESDIYERIPIRARKGPAWKVFESFVETSLTAVGAGSFNRRLDPHLTLSPLLVDEVGWTRMTKTLRSFEDALERVEVDLAMRRRRKGLSGFQASFLLSSFRAPPREMRR
jgi:hypothetical protein